jgi:hypothetical protein
MKRNHLLLLLTISIMLAAYFYANLTPVISWGPGANYRNVSVRTTVNVTQAYPEIINISCNSSSLTLNAGTTKQISCLVQIRDYNGGETINNTNMTFYFFQNTSGDPDDNNTHYSNSTCSEGIADGYLVNWTCAIGIWYYAVNGSWRANATVKDDYNLTSRSYANFSISPLYALNVTDVINFGDMAVGDTTADGDLKQANVTNLGNMRINVSVYAYAGDNETTGAGYAMFCSIRNITLPNERYTLNITGTYGTMTSITGSAVTVPNLMVEKQTVPTTYVLNTTYWALHVNATSNPFGICNGTVVFNAVAP